MCSEGDELQVFQEKWGAGVLASQPWFEALIQWQSILPTFEDWPSHDWLNQEAARLGVKNARGMPILFVVQAGAMKALDYERQIFMTGRVPTRIANWHDFFNALCWLRFPCTKSLLNAQHALSADEVSERGRLRDALTLFDECGVVVEYQSFEWVEQLQAHEWQGVWWDNREGSDLALRYTLFGHSEFEKGMQPFRGWTAKALFLPMGSVETLDERLAAHLQAEALVHPKQLSPLPVLGIPGWDAAQSLSFYQDTGYFRPKRISPVSKITSTHDS